MQNDDVIGRDPQPAPEPCVPRLWSEFPRVDGIGDHPDVRQSGRAQPLGQVRRRTDDQVELVILAQQLLPERVGQQAVQNAN